MKKNYIFLFLLLSNIHSYGQINWLWAHEYGGGSSASFAVKTSIDASNNVFMAGTFEGTQTFGPGITKTTAGNTDGFVARTDNNGTFAWVKTMGDLGSTVTCNDVATDAQGNVIVTGSFTNSMTIDTYTIYPYGFNGKDFFILKLDNNGVVLWLESAGGQSNDDASSVITDGANNIYVTGQYYARCYFNNNLDSISNANGSFTYYDIFIAKYDAAGNFVWAKSAGGIQGNDAGACIDYRSNYIFVGGSFVGTATFGTHQVTATGSNTDAFVAKYDLSGNNVWVVKGGGQSGESASGIGTDIYGDVFITGRFSGTANFGNGVSLTDPNNYGQMFIVKYDSTGLTKWGKQGGGPADDVGTDIAVDSFGLAVVTGQFVGTATFAPLSVTSAGAHDIFVVKYSMYGTPQWLLRAGGSVEDVGNGVAFSLVANEYYVTGSFTGNADFGTAILSSGGSIAKSFVGKIQGSYTGTPEISGFDNFSAYPNPADNMLTIQSPVTEKTECIITDATGRLVFSETLNNEFYQTSVNTEKWQQGLYFINLKSDKINSTNKVIIQH